MERTTNGHNIVHTDESTSYRRVMSASSMVKDYVRNRMDEEVGSIKEIMIDVPTGRVAYAVLAVGGFLGMGERLFAIPWNTLTLDEDRQCFVMDVDKHRLDNAPGFDKNNWPDMANDSWSTSVNTYWRDPAAASGISGHDGDDLGISAGRQYDRETTGFSDRDVDQKAREARRAVDSPEGESLRRAEQIGKSRARD